jgi:PAS domain S-box-containing protein
MLGHTPHIQRLVARFDDALESVRDYAIFLIDKEGRVASWNRGAQLVLRFAPEDIVGQPSDILFTPEDRARGAAQHELDTAVREGRSLDERWHIRGDQTRFFGSGIMTAVREADGELLGFIKILRDFTEQQQAAESLAASEQRYRLLVDSIKDYAIFMLDSAGYVTYWTRAAERITGYVAEEVVGQHLEIFFTKDDREHGEPYRELEEARLHGRAERAGWRCRRDGSAFWGEEIATAVTNSKGELQGFSKITRDSTVRMLADAERERLLQQATEANRIKDEFLGTVSHELRTPLNAVLGWTQLVRKGRMSPEAMERALEVIERNARTQAQLIEDLLDVSRVVSGQIRLSREPTSPVAAVMAAVETIKPMADAKRIELDVRADPMTVGNVMADPARLQQVVWNLLANGVKFTPDEGRVTVETARTDGIVEITVSDTGVGIATSFLPHVFDRFRQADSSTTRPQPGLGLGLAIVKHLVELHGGSVSVESPGMRRGSTFRVRLPVLHADEPAHAFPLLSRPPNTEALAAHRLAGLRIVAIDDDPEARALLETTLASQGARVTLAASVPEGIDAVVRDPPDVVLVDLAMPREDGYDFIRLLRSHENPRLRGLPAVSVTAHARSEDRLRLLGAGYQAHLPKPLELQDLVSTVEALVRPKRAHARGADASEGGEAR